MPEGKARRESCAVVTTLAEYNLRYIGQEAHPIFGDVAATIGEAASREQILAGGATCVEANETTLPQRSARLPGEASND